MQLPDPGLWIFAAVAVLVAVVFFGVRWYEKRRSEALENMAIRLGLAFREKDPSIGQQPFAALPLFGRGSARRFRNVASGADLWVFGYQYTTGTGKNKNTYRQTVIALYNTSVTLPAFQATPEGFFDKVAGVFGGEDLDFDEDPEFSRRYRVRGGDEAAVRRLFDSTLRRQLVSHPGWSVEGQGEWVILYRRRKRVAPEDLGTFVEQGRLLHQMVSRR